jgi:uncharacterized Zn finger protein (UPF0148 family)
MSGLVNLTCPSCGDSLQLPNGQMRTVCRSCGRQFAAKTPAGAVAAPTFACCPVCGQNDRVEKVSAIITRETQHVQGATMQERRWRDSQGRWQARMEPVYFASSQASALAEQLMPPAQPAPAKPKSAVKAYQPILIILIVGGAVFMCALIDSQEIAGAMTCGLLPMLGGGLGLFFGWRHYNAQKAIADAQTLAAHERWRRACAQWEQVYYCSRDDRVFIPASRTATRATSCTADL